MPPAISDIDETYVEPVPNNSQTDVTSFNAGVTAGTMTRSGASLNRPIQ